MSGPKPAEAIAARHRHRRRGSADGGHGRSTGGTAGNERLTALTGAALLVLFAAEGVTILAVQRLLTLHFFIGMLLAGPAVLKISSTGYRFARYYAGARGYVRKGPPAPLLRLLGPVVVLTSCGVIGTGALLAFAGPRPGPWLFLHKAFFVLWFGVMTIHVLAYLPRLARLAAAGWRGRPGPGSHPGVVVGGSLARLALLATALAGGAVLAVLTIHLAGPWQHRGAAAASGRQRMTGALEAGARSVPQAHRGVPGIGSRSRLPDDAARSEDLGKAVVLARGHQPGPVPASGERDHPAVWQRP